MCWEYSCICSFVHLLNQHLLSIYNEEGILADLGKNAIAAQQKMVKNQHKKWERVVMTITLTKDKSHILNLWPLRNRISEHWDESNTETPHIYGWIRCRERATLHSGCRNILHTGPVIHLESCWTAASPFRVTSCVHCTVYGHEGKLQGRGRAKAAQEMAIPRLTYL